MGSLTDSERAEAMEAAKLYAEKHRGGYWPAGFSFISGAEWLAQHRATRIDPDIEEAIVANHVGRIDRLMERLNRMESWARTVPSIQRFDESEPESERWRR